MNYSFILTCLLLGSITILAQQPQGQKLTPEQEAKVIAQMQAEAKKFTIPQLHDLYEGIYETRLDKRNFSRKVLSTKLLVKQKEKEKEKSKKGAFYYKLDRRRYNSKFHAFLNFIPNPDNLR